MRYRAVQGNGYEHKVRIYPDTIEFHNNPKLGHPKRISWADVTWPDSEVRFYEGPDGMSHLQDEGHKDFDVLEAKILKLGFRAMSTDLDGLS